MNTFSKKSNLVLLIISIVGILISSLLIMFSNTLTQAIYVFLRDVVFKRDFEFSKWSDTINSLLAFPVFIVVFVDALLFVKFSNKTKIILISIYGFITAFFILYCGFVAGNHSMDSDMASEILLAKECFLRKSFWPKTWHYSTEIRMLNTQIFTTPLFIFTKNLISIKSISALIISFLLPLSTLFLLHELKIKEWWLKALSMLLIFLPWSTDMWKFVQFGSYYIPHMAIAFIYIALFFAITYNKNEITEKKYRVLLIIFLVLAFISGLSGIRYILYFEFPVALTIVSIKVSSLIKNNEKYSFNSFFIEDKKVHLSLAALFLGAFGYICNTLILSRIYSFSDFNTTAFTHIGDVTFTDVHNAIFEILGYRNNVSVFTPSGVNNILVYVGTIFFLITFVTYLRKTKDEMKKVFIILVAVLFIFNAFTYINTDYVARYFILLLCFAIPCFAVFQESEVISVINKYFILLSFSIVMVSNSFIVFEENLCSKFNKDRETVAEFLVKNDYKCGYATFWNANVYNYLTNDKVQLANLYRYEEDGIEKITDEFKCDKWLTPESYYQKDFGNNEKVFLLVTTAEYNATPEANIFKNGKKVYNDKKHYVFEYKDNETFKKSF